MFIAEVNPVFNGYFSLVPNQSYTFITGIQVQLKIIGESTADYEITGDFLESPITGTITSNESKNITLTE